MTTDDDLGIVQQTLFIPLAGRARETRRRRPILRDPRAAEILAAAPHDRKYDRGMGGGLTIRRTAIFDAWVADFLAEHPDGTVIELGTGLNTRFERVDNGRVHWLDLDLPDTIELRRRYFADTDRRRMLAASITDDDWHDAVAELPPPYFFVSDGVFVYLPPAALERRLTALARLFPAARLAFDTYTESAVARERRGAERTGIAKWEWPCDDPRELERLGLRLLESVTATPPPPRILRRASPPRRLLLRAAAPLLGANFMRVNLFQVGER